MQIKKFFREKEHKIVLIFGFIIVAIISFEAGYLRGQGFKESPLIVEKSALEAKEVSDGSALAENKIDPLVNNFSGTSSNEPSKPLSSVSKNCPFVGSKNSDKYYPPDCQWAKRIKPENLVCFSSAEEARQKGYQPAKSCAK